VPPAAEPPDQLEPLRADPRAAAVLTDVDGTLAPIVREAGDAAVLSEAREALAMLADRYALVACISGRRAADARRMVGVDGVVYVGNHGLERLEPGSSDPIQSSALVGHERDAAAFADGIDLSRLAGAGRTEPANGRTRAEPLGLRVEDKGPIRALHWRGAADEQAAEVAAEAIAAEAEAAGLAVHRGRKVLELRPAVAFDKGSAIAELLADHPVRHALYAGDDRTDLDGFERLRELVASGGLETAVCVGIASEESPHEISARADLVVPDPLAFATLLHDLVPRSARRAP
jgi:HAD superfamily hydrolase (TIGR01484 family)